jgi:hypothetical protein
MLELNDEVEIVNNYYGAEEYKKQFIGHKGKIVNIYDDGNRFFYTVEGINYVWQNFNLKLTKKENKIKMSYNIFDNNESIIKTIDKLIGLEIEVTTIDGDIFKGKLIDVRESIVRIVNYSNNNKFRVRKNAIKTLTVNNYDYYVKITKKENELKMDKQKILETMEVIKNQQKELAKKMELLQREIEKEDNKKKLWTPKEGYLIWVINSEGIPSMNIYYGHDKISDNIIKNLNYYKTEEEAERVAFEQLLHRRIQQFADLNNEEEIDWDNKEQMKYYIAFQNNNLRIEWRNRGKEYGQVYFSSMDIANHALYKLGDDLYKYFKS